jgi:hypothetical protein
LLICDEPVEQKKLSEPRFYLDENVDPEVAVQLKRQGIDAVHVRELRTLGESDDFQISQAIEMERVFCSHDADCFRLTVEFPKHAGIAWSPHNGSTIGGWVRDLRKLHKERTAESMHGILLYLNTQ